MTPRKTLLLALALVILIVLSGWITEHRGNNRGNDSVADDEASSAPLVGSTAPDFTLQALNGQEVQLSSYRKKGPVVLAFWASWCGPCRMEMPMLETFYRQTRGSGVQLLAISIDSDASAARRFAEEYKLP